MGGASPLAQDVPDDVREIVTVRHKHERSTLRAKDTPYLRQALPRIQKVLQTPKAGDIIERRVPVRQSFAIAYDQCGIRRGPSGFTQGRGRYVQGMRHQAVPQTVTKQTALATRDVEQPLAGFRLQPAQGPAVEGVTVAEAFCRKDPVIVGCDGPLADAHG